MFDRLISGVVSVALAFLVWLYARSRDQEITRQRADPGARRSAGARRRSIPARGERPRLRAGVVHRSAVAHARTARDDPDGASWPSASRPPSRRTGTARAGFSTPSASWPPTCTRRAACAAQIAEGMNRVPVTLRRIVERRLPVRVDHGLHDRLLQCQAEPADGARPRPAGRARPGVGHCHPAVHPAGRRAGQRPAGSRRSAARPIW